MVGIFTGEILIVNIIWVFWSDHWASSPQWW